MKALLIDFGSTFTKVSLFSLDPPAFIGAAQAPTTVESGLEEGLEAALGSFSAGELKGVSFKRACSSAAGGLRIVAVGLVPQLTVKAAREAALGAGARVLASYAYTLSEEEIEEIRALQPDLLLLAGGTDGGDSKVILENAARIAAADLPVPVVVAGNKSAAGEAASLLRGKVPRVVVTANVMPEVNRLQVEPCRESIRELYLSEITRAKGLDQVQQRVGLVMPTPLAVMKAGELYWKSLGEDMVIVDLGGATTDVHSYGEGRPRGGGRVVKGPPEPLVKRSVEGDLGMRVSLPSLLEAIPPGELARSLPFAVDAGELEAYAQEAARCRKFLPRNERERAFEGAIAAAAIREALRRHAGSLTETYTPEGRLWVQRGKDLTEAALFIATGGVLVHGGESATVLKAALANHDPLSLTPRSPRLFLDRYYILAAAGLVAEAWPEAAREILKQALLPLEGMTG
ncbi:MAG TPA: methylaspartate mutase accessory protein GlmL [Bacillota bacterium]|nr:methylaspartate mutase accessory protein GlmL [Bacillota bacterium]